MNIFAIVVTYNALRNNWIDKCIKSLQNNTVKCEIVVVDNASTDGTRDYVPNNFPEIVWMPQDNNLGFGQANNLGIRYALEHNADFVLLINQDASLASDALELLLEAAAENDNALMSPLQLNGNGSKIDQMFKRTLSKAENGMMEDLIIRHEMNMVYTTGMFAAATWFMPAKMLKDIGGFNPLFFHYGEDDNYQLRLRYHGYKNIVVTKALMYHDRGEHGNMELFNKNKIRRELLVIACDINRSPLRYIVDILHHFYKCYIYYLPRRQYRLGSFSLAVLWIIGHICSINKSRKKEKQLGQTWLE